MTRHSLKRMSLQNGFKIEWLRLAQSSRVRSEFAYRELAGARGELFSTIARRSEAHWGVFLATVALFDKGKRFAVERRNGLAIKTELGAFAEIQWLDIPNRFPGVSLDHYVLMPDRITGLIVLPDESSDIDDDSGSGAITIDEVLDDTTRELRRLVLSCGSRIPSFPVMV